MSESTTELTSRVRELEEALRHTRAIADAERRRADALEEATRRAYRMAVGGSNCSRDHARADDDES